MIATVTEKLVRISAEEYHARLALSQSGMKDLAVSPLAYWYRTINPERPSCEPSAEQRFGTALHTLVLEGDDVFRERYACALNKEDLPNCLVTVDDLRGWLRDKGKKPEGTLKAGLIAQVQAVDPSVVIWDVICAAHREENDGKTICEPDEWARIHGAADALLSEPKLAEILRDGEAECSIFDVDPDTQTPIKVRLDWLAPNCILDLKTFSQKRGKSIDECVADAITYEKYYRQAFFYSSVHQRATGRNKPLKVVMAFVESDPPHEVRLRELRPTNYDIAALNVYWEKARIDVRYFCGLWRDCMIEFGDKPWRRQQRIELVHDEELRGISF